MSNKTAGCCQVPFAPTGVGTMCWVELLINNMTTTPLQLTTTTLYHKRCSSKPRLLFAVTPTQAFPTSTLAIHHYHPRGFPKSTDAAERLYRLIEARSEKQSRMQQPEGGEWRQSDKQICYRTCLDAVTKTKRVMLHKGHSLHILLFGKHLND